MRHTQLSVLPDRAFFNHGDEGGGPRCATGVGGSPLPLSSSGSRGTPWPSAFISVIKELSGKRRYSYERLSILTQAARSSGLRLVLLHLPFWEGSWNPRRVSL